MSAHVDTVSRAHDMQLFAADALLPGGWARDVLLQWNGSGRLIEVRAQAACPPRAARAAGPVIPGMPNLHSHAFQHAFAGLAESRGAERDSFWRWREIMYRFGQRIAPHQLEAVATHLYARMLCGGYTSVCEFHYLHNEVDGRAYADDATLSLCIVRAARRAGIGLTLLPVLYQASGFGDRPAAPEQSRFVRSTDSVLKMIERLRADCAGSGERMGLAPHSLRAVGPPALRDALAGLDAIDPTAPVHIHVAEQEQEVADCVAWSGQRPVAWLLDHVGVDARWCLVHATHLCAQETAAAARSGAVAGLCPSTEANLGDGIFDALGWRAAGGRWGVGSDSHVCTDAAEELMLLDYGQRLTHRRRNVMRDSDGGGVAGDMVQAAVAGGAQACARPVAGIAEGEQADFVVLDPAHAVLAGLSAGQMLEAHVFASGRASAVRDVCVAGRWRVLEGRHLEEQSLAASFVAARRELLTGR